MLLRRRAQEIVELADKTEQEFQRQEGELAGDISIGTGESNSMTDLSRRIAAFRGKHPLVRFHIYSATADEIQERLEAAIRSGLSPESEEGKEICALHRRWLTITGNQYDPAKHRGIAELYVMDERFTAYYDKQVPGCARFLRDAVLSHVPAAE